jgi:hypothetical protein
MEYYNNKEADVPRAESRILTNAPHQVARLVRHQAM